MITMIAVPALVYVISHFVFGASTEIGFNLSLISFLIVPFFQFVLGGYIERMPRWEIVESIETINTDLIYYEYEAYYTFVFNNAHIHRNFRLEGMNYEVFENESVDNSYIIVKETVFPLWLKCILPLSHTFFEFHMKGNVETRWRTNGFEKVWYKR